MVDSDKGSQYCSRDLRSLLLTNNCIQSMSGKHLRQPQNEAVSCRGYWEQSI